MLFAMSKIVTFGFERVVIFVFYLPTGATSQHNFLNIKSRNLMICRKGIFVD